LKSITLALVIQIIAESVADEMKIVPIFIHTYQRDYS